MAFKFYSDDGYKGEGVSRGLSRGLLVRLDGKNITREGMGIGAIAVRSRGFTYFSSDCSTKIIGPGLYEKRYTVNQSLLWSAFGLPSVFLTGLNEFVSGIYRKSPLLQGTLLNMGIVAFIRRILGLKAVFVPTAPVAEAVFTHAVSGEKVSVNCSVKFFTKQKAEVIILNEFGADLFDSGYFAGKIIGPPSGWQELKGKKDFPELYSTARKTRFRISSFTPARDFKYRVFWGSERAHDLCWAGFEFSFDNDGGIEKKLRFKYAVEFKTGGIK